MEGDVSNMEEMGACAPPTSSSEVILEGDDGCGTELYRDQESYLNGIHTEFLDKVNPMESGLLDVLREAEVLSSEDEQGIAEGNVRREKCRRFIKLLHRIPEADFTESFLPKFEKEYPHIAGGRAFRPQASCSEKCLRHAMMKRLNLKRLIDRFPPLGCCSQDEYNQFQIVAFAGEKDWIPVFEILRKNASSSRLCQEIEKLLHKKKIQQSEPYLSIATKGFPCSCHVTAHPVSADSNQNDLTLQSVMKLKEQFGHLGVRDEDSSANYPSTPPSSQKVEELDDIDRLTTDSGFRSVALSEAIVQPALHQQLFQTVEQKEKYSWLIDTINKAITTATTTRTDLRRLEMILDQARSVSKPAQDEQPSEERESTLQQLLTEAENHNQTVEQLYREVLQAWISVQNLDAQLDFELPEGWSQFLMIRYHLLRNEVPECKHIAKTAKGILDEIIKICQG